MFFELGGVEMKERKKSEAGSDLNYNQAKTQNQKKTNQNSKKKKKR